MTKGSFTKVWNTVTTILVVIVVLIAVFLMGSRMIGFRVFNVISGSMEPTYRVGDLIYVQQVEPTEIKVGDPITFVLNENLVVATHRVVEIDLENERFYTKGDANDTRDAAPVHFKNLIGRPLFSIPLLGYVSDFVQNAPGLYITIGFGVLLMVALFLPEMIGKKKEEELDPALVEEQEAIAREKAELEAMKAELEAAKAALEAQKNELAEKKEPTPPAEPAKEEEESSDVK